MAAGIDSGGDAMFGPCSDNMAAKDDGSETCLSTAMAEASLTAARRSAYVRSSSSWSMLIW